MYFVFAAGLVDGWRGTTVKAKTFVLVALSFAAISTACSKRETAPPPQSKTAETTEAQPAKPLVDVCSLLTAEEVASVQGEEVKDQKEFEALEDGLGIAECHFLIPGDTQAVRLRLVQAAGGANSGDPRTAWKEGFAPEVLAEKTSGRRKWEPPEAIPQLGEEAYWRGDSKNGALYVLKGNAYLRLTIGGREEKETKIKKCAALAEIALKRM